MDKKNIKVGVLTMHRVNNFGSFLQSYATLKIFENLGVDCELIDYKFPNKWHFRNGLLKENFFKRNLRKILMFIKCSLQMSNSKQLILAAKRYYRLSPKSYDAPERIINDPPIYNIYVVGSDQTWNIKHTMGDPIFLLSFAPDRSRRISFSSSMATKNLNEYYRSIFSYNLNKFNNISVRDTSGSLIIKEIINKDVKVTLDPTLVLPKESWDEFSSKSIISLGECSGFVLFYMLTYSFEPRPYIYSLLKDIQLSTGLTIFSFTKIPKVHEIKYRLLDNIKPEDFILFFKSATFVVTSSFHGTCFSLVFGKPLYSIIKDNNQEDDRQITLLENLGLSNCIVPLNKPYESITPYYDNELLQEKISILRNESLEYLKDCIF